MNRWSQQTRIDNQSWILRMTNLLLLFIIFQDRVFAQRDKQSHEPQPTYQFHITLEYKDAKGKSRNTTVYLWVPTRSKQLSGVVLGSQNVLEQWLFEHPLIRKVCSRKHLAIVWACPGFFVDGPTHHPELNIPMIGRVLDSLSNRSGYTELKQVPWLPVGHSGTNNLVDVLVEKVPEKLIAAIKMKGEPNFKHAEVPVLCTAGEYFEWNQQKEDLVHPFDSMPKYREVLNERAATGNLLSYFFDANTGHFDCSESLTKLVANYIATACEARLPASNDGSLKKVSQAQGWIAGLPIPGEQSLKPKRYVQAGPSQKSYPWFLSRIQAKQAWQLAHVNYRRKPQIAGFSDSVGRPAGFTRGIVWPIPYRVGEDGVTFSIHPVLFTQIPDTFRFPKTPLGHGRATPRVVMLCGNAKRVGEYTFQLAPERSYMGSATYFVIRMEGDRTYRTSIQPGSLVLKSNQLGVPQKIQWEMPAHIQESTKSIQLKAESNAGLKVSYYVKSGPAELKGNELRVKKIPVKAKYPVQVTVVAYQWGRNTPQDAVQTAPFVERTIWIHKGHEIETP
jgi:hypothetical protein